MFSIKIAFIFLLVINNVLSQTTNENTTSKTILKKSDSYSKEEPSYFSKLTSWMFPWSSARNDQTAAEGHHSGPQYMSPPNQHPQQKPKCNPCNQEPWVPMAAPPGSKHTVIGFAPPPSHQYGAPLPRPSYGPPTTLVVPPPQHYGPPSALVRPTNVYGPPPSLPANHYGPPSSILSPSSQYGPSDLSPPPPPSVYNSPLPPKFGPHVFKQRQNGNHYPPKNMYAAPSNPVKNVYPKVHGGNYQKGGKGKPGGYSTLWDNIVPPPLIQNGPGQPLEPLNNYGPPQAIGNSHQNVIPIEKLPPIEQLPLSTDSKIGKYYNLPIPLPNLSNNPVVPIHSHNDFNSQSNYAPPPSGHQEQDVQFLPSVKVADFVSSIEHPINVIQSPVYDLNVKSEEHLTNLGEPQKPPINLETFNTKPIQPTGNSLPSGYGSPTGSYQHVVDQADVVPSTNFNHQDVNQISNQNNHQPVSLNHVAPLQFNNADLSPPPPSSFGGNYGSTSHQSPQKINTYSNGVFENPAVFGGITKDSYQATPENSLFINPAATANAHQYDSEKAHSHKVESISDTSGFSSPDMKLSENPIVVEDTYTAASSIVNTTKENTVDLTPFEKYIPKGLIKGKGFNNLNHVNLHALQDLLQQHGISQAQVLKLEPMLKNAPWLLKPQVKESKAVTHPPYDYSQWIPTLPGWNQAPPVTTTQKPRQVQIIIPYVTSKENAYSNKEKSQTHAIKSKPYTYTTLVPIYTPPVSTQENLWTKFVEDINMAESQRISASSFTTTSTEVYNIKDLLRGTIGNVHHPSEKLPYDIISLQKNIDDWTQQEYSAQNSIGGRKSARNDYQRATTKFVSSKKIPAEYFTTLPYDNAEATTLRTITGNALDDNVQTAGSDKKETIHKTVESNLILDEGTIKPPQALISQSTTQRNDVTTKSKAENIFIVTPTTVKRQGTTIRPISWSLPPKVEHGVSKNHSYIHPKFLIRVEAGPGSQSNGTNANATVKVVLSEWPHRINNLQTTTLKPTLRHPLFGLMDVQEVTPATNTSVETNSGHSMVDTVTPSLHHKRSKRQQFRKAS